MDTTSPTPDVAADASADSGEGAGDSSDGAAMIADAAPDTADGDATDATNVPDATDGAVAEGGDAGPSASRAPHCVRDPDASVPPPFAVELDASFATSDLARVLYAGGSVLEAPTFVAVTYPDDPLADAFDEFVASIGCTDYWHTVMADYGVGDAVATTPVRLTSAAPATIDDTDIQTDLAAQVGTGVLPRPSSETVYVLVYPAGKSVYM